MPVGSLAVCAAQAVIACALITEHAWASDVERPTTPRNANEALVLLESKDDGVRQAALEFLNPEWSARLDWDHVRTIPFPQNGTLLALSWWGPPRGTLMLYDKSGAVVATIETGALESVEMRDLTGDSMPEIIIVSLRTGTGHRSEQFHIYRVQARGIQEIWSGMRRSHDSIPLEPVGAIYVVGALEFRARHDGISDLVFREQTIQHGAEESPSDSSFITRIDERIQLLRFMDPTSGPYQPVWTKSESMRFDMFGDRRTERSARQHDNPPWRFPTKTGIARQVGRCTGLTENH